MDLVSNGLGWSAASRQDAADRATRHGYSRRPEYKVWQSMKQRCLNPKAANYYKYGAVGITICRRWLKFENFLADMGDRPSPKHMLERVRSKKGYSPANCCWATSKTQNRNRSCVPKLRHQGRSLSAAEWAEITGIPSKCIRTRVAAGWSVQDALTIAVSCKVPSPKDVRKQRAHKAVRQALQSGQLQQADRCQHRGCLCPAVVAHHYRGYDPRNWLKVRWLCRKHHGFAHRLHGRMRCRP